MMVTASGIFATGGSVAIAACASVAATAAPVSAQQAVQAVLDESAGAWNAGDLDRFMTCYERGATTSYVSGSRVVWGYDAIRAMYGERFGGGDKAAMGRLTLEILNLRMIDADHALVIGRFHLSRAASAGGDATGLTTLLFHRGPAGWRIISDHS